jgi:protoporphyrinogen oxidase
MADLQNVRFLILGAGPAGLATGASLLRRGEKSFLILEKESTAGGLCRSAIADGFPMDIGGGHLLEAGNAQACDFIFSFLPKDNWRLYTRQNGILFRGQIIDFPFEAHLHQLPEDLRGRYIKSWEEAPARRGDGLKNMQTKTPNATLESSSNAGAQSISELTQAMPNSFCDWARRQLGDAIADDYLLPYNRKLWGDLLPLLGADWLHKLPPDRENPDAPRFASHNTFYYPTIGGFGEAFLRMAKELDGHIVYNCPAEELDPQTRTVNGQYRAEKIVNTVPWQTIDALFPAQVREWTGQLHSVGVRVEYHADHIPTDTQAIYYPDADVPWHRAVLRYNYNKPWPGYWTETGIHGSGGKADEGGFVHPFAYPAPTIGRQELLQKLFEWAKEQGIVPLGRWGEWAYINTDEAVCRGLELAGKLLSGEADFDVQV